VADFDKVIPPGQEGNIKVKVHGSKIHPGPMRKSYTVITNDPENRKIILRISGSVERIFEVSKQISLAGFIDEDLKQDIFVNITHDEPIHLTEFKWDLDNRDSKILSDLLGVKLEEIKEGKKYKFSVWNKERMKPGRYLGRGDLITDFEDVKKKRITIRVTITPDVALHPSTLFMGEMYLPEGVTKSFDGVFRVISSRGDSLKIERVVPGTNDMTVSVKEMYEGKSYVCKVKVRPEPKTGRYSNKITVYTNYPGFEKIEMDVTGIVRVGLTSKK
jgi:hypothetical protein